MALNTTMMSSKQRGTLIVIAGPTGSGKTTLAVELAGRLGAPVISTDSRQVFRGMAIGTAQPSPEELSAVKHYFIADRDISDDYTAGKFEKEAIELLDMLFETNEYVIAVGGSGLYINALCHGFDDMPTANEEIRAQLSGRLAAEGLGVLVTELRQLDPAYSEEVDLSNPARVIRALEVCIASGKPYSALRKGHKAVRDFRIIKFAVDMPREELYMRINQRVDMMIAAGLEDEAKALSPYRDMNALQTVGYKELFDYFDGNSTFDEAVELIKRNSRRYAKRQLTWFRRDPEIIWLKDEEIRFAEKIIQKFVE